MTYAEVQGIARDTIAHLRTVITPGMTLKDVRQICEDFMRKRGADSFWYYDIGAFVFAGDETAVSVSGRDYVTSDRVINDNDIVTVDLSPQHQGIWGDFARTIILENSKAADSVAGIQNPEWHDGLLTERRLHEELCRFATPETAFETLYDHMNALISASGYINLDCKGNLGHSIVKQKDGRIYIEQGNRAPLSSVPYFTFEPHIGRKGSPYGYKHENIYYFADGQLKAL